MQVTVVVCTLNRATRLRSVLTDLSRQEMPANLDWNVLVVDNGSEDQTRSVVEEFMKAEPGRFHYLHERRRGKSFALNAGVEAATASVLAFTDDDLEIDRRWLPEMVRAFDDAGCAGAGGRILPAFQGVPPDWLAAPPVGRHILGPLAQFDLGDTPVRLTRAPYGGNVAFQRAALMRHGGFRTDLGPTESAPLGRGEDVEMANRLLRAGEVLMYVPRAIVRNIVPTERMTKRYFAAWWFHHGLASMRADGHPPGTRSYFGVPGYLCRGLVASAVRWLFSLKPRARFFRRLEFMEILGQLVEAVRTVWGGARKDPGPSGRLNPF
jgi:glycosyltransferase involved in cell wall biosynthesis